MMFFELLCEVGLPKRPIKITKIVRSQCNRANMLTNSCLAVLA